MTNIASYEDVQEALKAHTDIAKSVVLKADKNLLGGALNIYVGGPLQRYPDDTVYAPTGDGYRWTWGPSFEYSAPGNANAETVASLIANSVTERKV